jgi:UDP-N-acetylmuramyl pentapeptide phosphotransferase/UDP-N-acetylglucosamine-1-phosphate transferase
MIPDYYLIGLFILLFFAAEGYFYLANKLTIIDNPNQRSSHTKPTIRGGGVVVVLAMLTFLIFHQSYLWFGVGLAVAAFTGFMDDLKGLPKRIRILLYFTATALLMYESGIPFNWYIWLPAFILIAGIINVVNFMDGINGITGLYSMIAIVTLWWLHENRLPPSDALPYYYFASSLLGLTVFGFYNFRAQARCFAGDIGSISVALIILLPLLILCVQKGTIVYLTLLCVYGVDTFLTACLRLANGENIFTPHRKHLFQLMANEMKMPHMQVSAIYGIIQISINILFVLTIENTQSVSLQAVLLFMLFLILASVYWIVRNLALRISRAE